MEHQPDELDHLHDRDVILDEAKRDADRRAHIIKIHHDVDRAIDDD